ncbi:CoA ester lyase [Pseudonocardia sp.]|jgi:citrate lyase subunit beta/citryl-CoA lyase|uniref:HpcH/HpaI aldolase/citrate lyase family protein n=1 Tax=Pseudonocardia sp. TaxID=60912 RepID=UPI002638426A|nr:CoA ester lyase [Pseudonocardia sp.]MCW2721696.1 CoA ester lyase [Pseudonocardia sp.]MDT7615516.1 citrate lyase subunit beta / citryl-CoA lyase [Pseudonocardiales bacterium]
MTTALRSLLFVPGGRADMIAKVGRAGADGVVLDLEDAVAATDKDTARATVVDALGSLEVPDGTLVLVRVNATDSPWFAEDVAAVVGTRADGVVLPKLERTDQLAELQGHHLTIIGGLETALGVADARPLLAAGAAMGLVAAYFGAEDFIADMGGRRTPEGTEVLYARSQVALAARLAGVAALDQVVTAVRDDAAFRADAEQARALGYPGKLCIHPAQVPLAHEVFTPSEAEVTHARAVLAASEKGVGLLDGEMVDDVHVRMARATLARAGTRQ